MDQSGPGVQGGESWHSPAHLKDAEGRVVHEVML